MINSEWDNRFLELAKFISRWSKDPSTQTGAVIVRPDKTIASVGYNGFPRGMSDAPSMYKNREEKYSRIIHCEVNAVSFCSDTNLRGYSLYTYPFMSCDRCFVQMVQTGISRFVFPVYPKDKDERWRSAFAKVRQYADELGVEMCEI